MKTREIKTNLGMVALGAIDILEDSVEVFFDVEKVSDELQELINKEIEVEKVRHDEAMKEYLHGRKWSEYGVNITGSSVRVNVTDKKEVEAVLFVNFEDKEDERMWSDVSFNIDVSAHSEELKQMIVKAVVNKFF